MKIIFAALFISGLLVTTFGFAQNKPFFRHNRVMNELKLTQDQETQFKKIRFETQKKNIETRAKLETARLELRQLFDADKQERSAIEKKISDIAALQASLKVNRYNAWADCNKLLSSDQQKVWKRMLFATLQNRTMNFRNMRHRCMMNHRMGQRNPMGLDHPMGPGSRMDQRPPENQK